MFEPNSAPQPTSAVEQQKQSRRRTSSIRIQDDSNNDQQHRYNNNNNSNSQKQQHEQQQKKTPKEFADASTDSADLDSFAPQMDVYIPLHISGDGVSRAITKSKQKSAERKQSVIANSSTATTTATHSNAQSRKQSIATGTTTAIHQHDEADAAEPMQHQNQDSTANMNRSANLNRRNSFLSGSMKNPKKTVLDEIPENFPIPATCPLSDIVAKLEGLLDSKVFLGFIDSRTGGLVELRESTLELFNLVPDQKKVIHCRMLKKEKTRSELLLEASVKKPLNNSQQQNHEQDPSLEGEGDATKSKSNAPNRNLDPEPKKILELEMKMKNREAKEKEQNLVQRLVDDDLKRREIKLKKLEQRIYPSQGGDATMQHHPFQNALNSEQDLDGKKKSKKQMEQILERLNDVEGTRRRREAANEQNRARMIADGYIVEPDFYKKVSAESVEERNERHYGRGVQWLMKHNQKVAGAQQKERERKAPKLKSKEEWDAWYSKLGKPLERDKFAAQNQPVFVPIGGGAPIDMSRKAQTPQPK